MESEEWRYIEGFKGLYMVSSFGRVKSCERYISVCKNGKIHSKKINERIIKQSRSGRGYLKVCLSNKSKKYTSVHIVVLSCFVKKPSKLHEVNHIDGNKKNNNIKNLEWCSKSENQKHSYDILKRNRFEVIKKEMLPEINAMIKSGMSQREVANHFGAAQTTISSFLKRIKK